VTAVSALLWPASRFFQMSIPWATLWYMGTALITGASSGIGLEFAWQLATARNDLVLVARNRERLEQVAAAIRAAAGVKVEVLPADLANPADVARVAERLRVAKPQMPSNPAEVGLAPGQTQGPVGLLVNNAGFGTGQALLGGDIEAEIQAINVMVTAVMVLSQAAAEQMVARGRGAIINVGSIAALTAGGTYAAAKAWVRTFTESLATELAGTGVTATVVAPGLTRTEFHERSGIDAEFPGFAWLNPAQVVAESLADVRRGAVHSTPSRRYKAAAAVLRAAPRGAIRAMGSTGLRRKPSSDDAITGDDAEADLLAAPETETTPESH